VFPLFLDEWFEYAPELRKLCAREINDQLLGHNFVQGKMTEIIAKIAPGIGAFTYVARESLKPALRRRGSS
jgi:hypothetical protein